MGDRKGLVGRHIYGFYWFTPEVRLNECPPVVAGLRVGRRPVPPSLLEWVNPRSPVRGLVYWVYGSSRPRTH